MYGRAGFHLLRHRMLLGYTTHRHPRIWTRVEFVTDPFQDLIEMHATGDIEPLGGELVSASGFRFGGHNYDSQLNRTVLTVAESETLTGEFSTADRDTVAEVAALLPRQCWCASPSTPRWFQPSPRTASAMPPATVRRWFPSVILAVAASVAVTAVLHRKR